MAAIPSTVVVECRVERAVPNVLVSLHSWEKSIVVVGAYRTDVGYTARAALEMNVTDRTLQTQTLQCLVVWMRRKNNETIAINKTIDFQCKLMKCIMFFLKGNNFV